jgi:hypothetical protein
MGNRSEVCLSLVAKGIVLAVTNSVSIVCDLERTHQLFRHGWHIARGLGVRFSSSFLCNIGLHSATDLMQDNDKHATQRQGQKGKRRYGPERPASVFFQ